MVDFAELGLFQDAWDLLQKPPGGRVSRPALCRFGSSTTPFLDRGTMASIWQSYFVIGKMQVGRLQLGFIMHLPSITPKTARIRASKEIPFTLE